MNKKEIRIDDSFENNEKLMESLLQMKKELNDYKEARMRSVPVIHVIDDDATKKEDDTIVPVIEFDESIDENINGHRTMHR